MQEKTGGLVSLAGANPERRIRRAFGGCAYTIPRRFSDFRNMKFNFNGANMDNEKVIAILEELWRFEHSEKFTEAEIREAIEIAIAAIKQYGKQ